MGNYFSFPTRPFYSRLMRNARGRSKVWTFVPARQARCALRLTREEDFHVYTCRPLLVTGAMLGMDVRICAPAPLQPSAQV